MSTKQRYMNLVADAVKGLSYRVIGQLNCFLAVGEVAAAAGVSKPTAAKYLKEFEAEGYMSGMNFGKQRVYRLLERGDD